MYINLLNAEFVYDILGGLSIQSFLAILLPWAAWLMGEFYRLIYIYYVMPMLSTTEKKQLAFIHTATFFYNYNNHFINSFISGLQYPRHSFKKKPFSFSCSV